eukprot:CAMPEP_0195537846 /NCGR_PEP_ID=MMETSP0794_2-20130614/48747_1 /TAXON_ID=515487 /ORGANISM="Stephanopyxis turris, Strain CCMP 815" /LENGTH=99 /DNA_ID=CAMNT_0040671693 /DNA_START=103 /DNA_END=402 /DNA_ORIENTATION=-
MSEAPGAHAAQQEERSMYNHAAQVKKWEEQRRSWIESDVKSGTHRFRRSMYNPRARNIDSEIIRNAISRQGPSSLPASVTLPQMVDLLCDMWEAEGLFE